MLHEQQLVEGSLNVVLLPRHSRAPVVHTIPDNAVISLAFCLSVGVVGSERTMNEIPFGGR